MSTGKVVEALKSPFRGRHGQLHSFRRIVKELMIGAMTENKKKMLLIAKDMLDYRATGLDGTARGVARRDIGEDRVRPIAPGPKTV